MPRDYAGEYERRQELAQEHGFDSFYHERQAREFAYEMGADRSNVGEYALFFDNYQEGDLDQAGWIEVYADLHGLDPDDFDDWADDFYDWLQEYYDNN